MKKIRQSLEGDATAASTFDHSELYLQLSAKGVNYG